MTTFIVRHANNARSIHVLASTTFTECLAYARGLSASSPTVVNVFTHTPDDSAQPWSVLTASGWSPTDSPIADTSLGVVEGVECLSHDKIRDGIENAMNKASRRVETQIANAIKNVVQEIENALDAEEIIGDICSELDREFSL